MYEPLQVYKCEKCGKIKLFYAIARLTSQSARTKFILNHQKHSSIKNHPTTSLQRKRADKDFTKPTSKKHLSSLEYFYKFCFMITMAFSGGTHLALIDIRETSDMDFKILSF
jgi:hypothetical protein